MITQYDFSLFFSECIGAVTDRALTWTCRAFWVGVETFDSMAGEGFLILF